MQKEAAKLPRKLVINFLKKKQGTQIQAAGLFGLSLNGVQRIWRRYKEKGYRGLASKKRGVQGGKKINAKQAAEVRQLIRDKLPDQLKLPFGLWTREAVQQLILDRFGIELSRWQVGRYFKVMTVYASKAYEQGI